MKKIVCLIVLTGIIFGINSCKEEVIFEKEIAESETSFNFSIEDAKVWMETKNQADLDFKSAGKIKKKFKLSKLWNKAKRSENDNVVAVEVPLNSIDKFGFLTSDTEEMMRNTGIFDYALSETSLLIQKNKETGLVTAHFMTVVGDPEYLDKTDFKVNTNKFLKKDKDFSGMVLFHELNGLFNIGWKYYDGVLTHIISGNSSIESGLRLKGAQTERVCYHIEIYEVVTYYHIDNMEFIVDRVVTNVLESYDVCEYSSDGPVGGGPAPGEPVDEADPQDCNCDICPVCGKCIPELLKGATVLPPDDNGGTDGTTTSTNETTFDCPVCSCPEIDADGLEGYDCAAEVYQAFSNFDNIILNLLNNTFGSSDSYHVKFNAKDLPSNIDGEFGRTETPETDVDGNITSATFFIDINTYILTNSTKEYIGVTFAHEAIHAVVQYYEDNDPERGKELFPIFYETPDFEDGDHLTMGNLYVDEMKDIILQINPNMPASDATCLAWGGLQNTRAYDMKRFQYDQINGEGAWNQLMAIVNQREKDGETTANGTKCPVEE